MDDDKQNPWGLALGIFRSTGLVLAFIFFALSQTMESLVTPGQSASQLDIASWFAMSGVTALVGFMIVGAVEWRAQQQTRPEGDAESDGPGHRSIHENPGPVPEQAGR
ncbi:hypothetical protein [Agromyces sp. NPDC058064]|uniref:hypothetical protein n=1 Tax=Agromyces sp. NPDC058064 TaxID=3346322 RepID=UPI0036DBEB0A